jgi:hypothetical protein
MPSAQRQFHSQNPASQQIGVAYSGISTNAAPIMDAKPRADTVGSESGTMAARQDGSANMAPTLRATRYGSVYGLPGGKGAA